MDIYEVGGAVRDALLGLPVVERDWLVVGATPEALTRLGYRQVGQDFPVFLHPRSKEEYALARTERKTGPGYTGFSFDASASVTLEEDLARRDLTVNAMAKDREGRIIDPYGGRADLEKRVLRHVSPAFREDPLRVLRTARFAAQFRSLDFVIAPETLTLMTEISASGELEALRPERVWQETHKALTTQRPDVYFEVLRECGALSVLFPEVDRLFGVPQPARWHPEIDTGVHTLMALKQSAELCSEPAVHFAVLTHDLGKGTTPKAMLPRHAGHSERSVELLEAFAERLPVPRRYLRLAIAVARHHGTAHRASERSAAKLFELINAVDGLRNPQRFEEFLCACEADARGRAGLEQRPYPQAALLREALRVVGEISAATLVASGLDGAALGRALRERRIAALADLLRDGQRGSTAVDQH